ncbi:Planctomycete cytochrome C [Neorhodopirellula lusitana]|uniref:Planctomycete cytochrome C n=1 Tax=Neorhodopirellula lusitana TaxID=445327 RepID=A0ABY1QN41_9BACT|nr:Planctomycete cytochrome C [Neorhodopirellula lusitana]
MSLNQIALHGGRFAITARLSIAAHLTISGLLGLTLLGLILFVSIASTALAADASSDPKLQFFEEKIRPILVTKCYQCHGPEKSESGLRLDSRASILAGGASDTPAAKEGDADHSLLIESVTYEGDYDMPPDKPLSSTEIDQLKQWIQLGLPWPDEAPVKPTLTIDQRVTAHQAEHWSLQPVQMPVVPASSSHSPDGVDRTDISRTDISRTDISRTDIDRTDIDRTDIDRLIESKLTAAGLAFSQAADRRTLIRRAHFDLLGLPPSEEQVHAFVNDPSPDAWARLIDQLLDSPHYGERWARHWLDVARYADTRGYSPGKRDKRFPFAYTYRDWVIEAFNRDLPYDDFIRCQLAADQWDSAEQTDLAALGFLTVGRQYLSRNDMIDDRVDAVTRGLLGLTVSCARCHDHKFDGIPTQDYYSLFSVFENCSVPSELPLITEESKLPEFSEFLGKLDEMSQAIEERLDEIHNQLHTQAQTHPADYLARLIEPDVTREAYLQEQDFVSLKLIDIHKRVLQRWKNFVNRKDAKRMAVFMPWHELLELEEEGFAEAAMLKIESWKELPAEKVNPLILNALLEQPPSRKIEVARVYGHFIRDQWAVMNAPQDASESERNETQPVAPVTATSQQDDPSRNALLAMLSRGDSPLVIKRGDIRNWLDQGQRADIANREAKINELNSNAPEGLHRAMIVVDREPPNVTHVMIRGSAGRRGEVAPRRFLKLLSPSERALFNKGAGRLELADAIASPDNPLTARVFVNRIWMHHFNRPLVDTPSDFGIQCDEPVQRDLLDDLAADFMQNGWSIKHLHRRIMLSHAYQQSSHNRDDCLQADPENRLIWRMNRRRLEFEALRDSLLAVSGSLETTMFGKSTSITTAPFSHRRTIYGTIDRQDLPGLFRAFDFASPDQSVAKRTRTIVPQQSLFMLNSPFAIEQSQRLVAHVTEPPTDATEAASEESAGALPQERVIEQQIIALYQQIFARVPTDEEREIGKLFVSVEQSSSSEGKTTEIASSDDNVWTRYAQMLLMTNEFEFID